MKKNIEMKILISIIINAILVTLINVDKIESNSLFTIIIVLAILNTIYLLSLGFSVAMDMKNKK